MKKSEKLLGSRSNTFEDFSEISKSPKLNYNMPDINISSLSLSIPKLITDIN